jgi:uncharacterized membrane protein
MTLVFKITLIITAFLLALITGLFYSYTVSVNPGLGKLSDAEYIKAMQSINRAILNPWFFASFMGSLILLPVSTWMSFKTGGYDLTFNLLLAATVLYAAGVFGVTVIGNVPLNETLDRFNTDGATIQEIKNNRTMFEIPWSKLNLIRTVANMLSLIALLIGIIRKV